MNNRGAISDLFVFIAVAIFAVLILGGLAYVFGEVNSAFEGIEIDIGDTNFTAISQDSMGQLNSASNTTFKWLAFIIMFGMILSIFVTSFLVRVHPLFFFVYVGIAMIAVFVAVPVANAYEEILTTGGIGPTLHTFSAANYVLLNLPVWVAIIGLLGAVFLLINIRGSEDAFESPI